MKVINLFQRKKRSLLKDFIYYFLTGAGIIFFWRGIWGLLDIFLFPGYPIISNIVSLAIGILILYLNDYSLSELEK